MMRTLLALVFLLIAASVQAHPLAPAMLELRETATDHYEVIWRTSTTRAGSRSVFPQMPDTCRDSGDIKAGLEGDAWVSHWTVVCAGGLMGRDLAVSGLDASRISVVLRLRRAGQPDAQALLDYRHPRWSVPPPQEATPVFLGYFGLGVGHLLGGFDHVLFIAGLVLLVRRPRPLVLTITAFTLGHSVTLSLATLGLIHVNAALMELGIALSILVLACEVARPREQGASLLARRPWLMAAGFGLLHGLGFAGALAAVGLPQADIPLALLAFNLGIEAGQLMLIAVLLALAALLRRLPVRARARLGAMPAAYLIGTLAAYWCCERAVALL